MTNKQQLETAFLRYIKQYEGPFTDCEELRRWMDNDKKKYSATSIEDLKQAISDDRNFEDRHLRKVDGAFKYFQEQFCLYALSQSLKVEDIP